MTMPLGVGRKMFYSGSKVKKSFIVFSIHYSSEMSPQSLRIFGIPFGELDVTIPSTSIRLCRIHCAEQKKTALKT